MTVSFDEYLSSIPEFIKNHGGIKQVITSNLKNGIYHKEYIANDGGIFYEINSVEYVVTSVKEAKVTLKMMKTEFFDSDNSISRYCYQQY